MYKHSLLSITLSLLTFSVNATDYPGAVKIYDIKLNQETQFNAKQALKKTFKDFNTEGWLADNGEWHIKGTVTHNRLRCATYQLGVQLGKGNPACLNIEWLTDVQYGTTRQHCNSSPLVHVGGGNLPALTNILKDATCARVVVRCTGTCDKASK